MEIEKGHIPGCFKRVSRYKVLVTGNVILFNIVVSLTCTFSSFIGVSSTYHPGFCVKPEFRPPYKSISVCGIGNNVSFNVAAAFGLPGIARTEFK